MVYKSKKTSFIHVLKDPMKILYKIFSCIFICDQNYILFFRVKSFGWRCRGYCLFLQTVPRKKLLKFRWTLVWFDDFAGISILSSSWQKCFTLNKHCASTVASATTFPTKVFSIFISESIPESHRNNSRYSIVMWTCTRSADITLNSLLKTLKGFKISQKVCECLVGTVGMEMVAVL